MSNVVRLADRGNPRRLVVFSRGELNQMLSIYSQRVMQGEWRDYAIDHGPGVAAFSIYRDSSNQPIFTIVKFAPGSGGDGDYLVRGGGRTLKRGVTLAEVLKIFKPVLRVLSS
jgi:hypothetical protein